MRPPRVTRVPAPWIVAYARWVIRWRWATLAAVLALSVAFGVAATRLHVEVDPDRQLPQDHPYIQTLNDLHRLFGDKNLVVIGLFPHDHQVFTPAFLAKLAEITERVRRVPGANPALVQSLAAPQVKAMRGTDDGFAVERVMATPPSDAAGAEAVRRRAYESDLYVDTLVARDGTAAAVHASFELTPATPGYRQLHAAVLAAVQAAADGTFDYHLSGPVVFLSRVNTYASRIAYFFPLALVVIGLVHYHAFRTLQALFLPLVTALLSVVWALGAMGLLDVPLDHFNTTTPILILAVAAGHAVQVLKRFYEEYDRTADVDAAIVASLIHVGPVMLAAGSVAAVSFCSLITFGTATIRTFGLFTALGIVSALVIEMTCIPAVRACLPAPRARERSREAAAHPWLDALLARASGAVTRAGAWRVFAAVTAVLVVAAVSASRLEIDTSMKRELRASDPVRQADAIINRHFAGTNTLVLMVEGAGEGALEEPALMQAIFALERRLEAEAGVGKALSYVDFVRQMHVAMRGEPAAAGAPALPATRALTAQYLFLYSLSGGAEDFDTLIDPTHRVAKVRVLVHDDRTRFGQHLIAATEQQVARTFPPGVRVRYTGTLASSVAATEVMVRGKIWNIVQIALITILIAGALLRSLVGGLLVATPLALTVAVNFGVMGLLGVPLDMITSAIAAMAVGIGADYAMYLMSRLREELELTSDLDVAMRRALATSGKAVLFVSSAIALGYATLCLSGFKIHVQLGLLVALAMVVSSVSTLVLLPALIGRLRPRFLGLRDEAMPLASGRPVRVPADTTSPAIS